MYYYKIQIQLGFTKTVTEVQMQFSSELHVQVIYKLLNCNYGKSNCGHDRLFVIWGLNLSRLNAEKLFHD